MKDSETVIVSKQGYVATVLLNRPETLNSFNREMRLSLHDALSEFAQDDEIRVIVLGGVGRGFSSGTDLAAKPLAGQTVEQVLLDEYWPSLKLISDMDKTVIAANPGTMAGIGCAYVMHCDLAVMSEEGSMMMAFSNVGLIPDGGLASGLLKALGYQRAYKLIAEGGRMDAQACLDAGVVTRLAPKENVLAEAQAWAAELAMRPPIALREAKRLLRNAATQTIEETVKADAFAQDLCMATADSKEAVSAFREKRKPVFVGR